MADGLVAGDVEAALADLSPELRRNMGEVVTLLPLPATEATVESVEPTAKGWAANLRILGETDEVVVATRWKDRDGRPTIIEVSHLAREARAPEATEEGAAPGSSEGADGHAQSEDAP
jgi:DNA-binding GntR family transcriptional regulator